MLRTIEITVFVILSLLAGLAVHAWLASRDEQQRLTSALATQKQLLDSVSAREQTRDASLNDALAQIDKLKRDTQTPAQIVSGLSKYLSLPQPITLVQQQSSRVAGPAESAESQKGIGLPARQGTSAYEKPPAPCEASSAQPSARIAAKTHKVSRLAAGLKRKLRNFSGSHKIDSGCVAVSANRAPPPSSGDSFVPNLLGRESPRRIAENSAASDASSPSGLSAFDRNAQQGTGAPLPNGSGSRQFAPKPDESATFGSSLPNVLHATEQGPPVTDLPQPGKDRAPAPEPTAPTASCAKSGQCNAQVPVADLKPLYNYVQDCRACQAQLQAAKQNSADDALKLAALTRERDAAITAAKGGSFLRRLRSNVLWFATGALVGFAASHR